MYRDFATAYGTLCLVVLAVALLTQTHINTGWFGLFGFPVLSFVYALYRSSQRDPRDDPRNQ